MTTDQPTTTTDPKLCTVCVNWRCNDCGWTRPNANRNYPQTCAHPHGGGGTFTPVRHQSATRAEQHRLEWERYTRERPVPEMEQPDPEWQVSVMALALTAERNGHLAMHYLREAGHKHTRKQSREHVEAFNEGVQHLRRLEREVRAWVAAHPEVPDA